MHPIYCADPAIQTAIADALDLHGLWPDPAAVARRPQCADRLEQQLARVAASSAVLATVRALVPVDEPTRRLIERLVDSASASIESDAVVVRHSDSAQQPAPADSSSVPPLIVSRRAAKKVVRA